MDKYKQSLLASQAIPYKNKNGKIFLILDKKDKAVLRDIATSLAEMDYWEDEHPDYPKDDWRYEVEGGNTLQGYWAWVVNRQHEDEQEKDHIKAESRANT